MMISDGPLYVTRSSSSFITKILQSCTVFLVFAFLPVLYYLLLGVLNESNSS